MIQINQLNKSFGKQKVLQDITFEANRGEVIAVSGPNGSGKSTLMKAIVGLVLQDSGEILVNGLPASNPEVRRGLTYMPQIARFPENLSVAELIKMVKDIRGEKVDDGYWINLFGLEKYLKKRLKNLSGGTRQKVNAVLALMFDTKVIIVDEPTVGLDPLSRIHFKEVLTQKKNENKTILWVTHLLNEVEDIADKALYILEGQIFYYGEVKTLKRTAQASSIESAIAKISTVGLGSTEGTKFSEQ